MFRRQGDMSCRAVGDDDEAGLQGRTTMKGDDEANVSAFKGNPVMAEGLKAIGMAPPTPSAMENESEGEKRRSVYFGVLTSPVDSSSVPSAETRANLRELAAENLMNIDSNERSRRLLVARIFFVVTAILATILYLETDANSLSRFLIIFFPMNLGLGYYKSAKSGL